MPRSKGLLSVVIPAYNEELNIEVATKKIAEVLHEAKIPFEIVFVNDGSKDATWERIAEQAAKSGERALDEANEASFGACIEKEAADIVGISFSRNFGKEAAILAGMATARGDCVAVMDCDMQHPPELLPEMYSKWKEGYEVIEGVKSDRGKESAAYGVGAKIFYGIISKAVKIDMNRASDYKLLDRKVVGSILALPERHMFFRAISSWVGYRTTSIEYKVAEREYGSTKWSAMSLMKYAISSIISYTTAPMQIVTGLGFVTLIIALILGIQTLAKYFSGTAVEGFTTVIILLLFIGSIIMICMGITGIYISKIYEEVQRRPRYIISESIGGGKSSECAESIESRINE